MIVKFIHSRFFYPIILLALSIPTFIFLLQPGQYWNMHDDMQMIRQMEMEKCFKDGQIPCRWSPDLGFGYGYPLFNFYPPMPYFVGQFFRIFGFTFMTSVKLTALAQIVASLLAMYLLASTLFGRLGGLISALFYAYAPYHAVNIYVRGAMNEAWAAVFFPLIFYFSRKLILKTSFPSLILLSLSFSGLLLSHHPMTLTFTPLLALWSLYWFYQKPKLKTAFYLIGSGIFTLTLSAFFTLPGFYETKFVQIDSMFNNYYHFSVHFVSLFQLFISRFWGNGASVWGPEDNMSFMVGYLHWGVPLFILLSSIILLSRHRLHLKNVFLPLLLIGFGLFNLFMTHNKSTPIWLLFPPLQKIQFPWRFLNLGLFFLSLSSGFLAKLSKPLAIIIIPALIVLNYGYFTPITHGPLTDQQKFSGLAWINQITSGIYDYLPKTARIAPQKAATEYIDEVSPLVTYQLSGQKHGTDWLFFNLDLSRDTTVILSQLAFPGFVVLDRGQALNYQIEPELGRITLKLAAGNHQIYLKLRNTPIRTLGNYLSLASFSVLLLSGAYFVTKKWTKKKSK